MQLNDTQKQTLLNLAENSILQHLGLESGSVNTTDPLFQEKSGIFVTLQKNKQLRGCIGSLSAHQSILDGVKGHAVNAAFHDHRFPPVTAKELPELTIEISILTPSIPLEFKDGADLLQKLRPNHDGVTLSHGNHSATFLPQVWEQLPDPEQFLTHLSMKAGLPPHQWQKDGLRIEIYHVIKF